MLFMIQLCQFAVEIVTFSLYYVANLRIYAAFCTKTYCEQIYFELHHEGSNCT